MRYLLAIALVFAFVGGACADAIPNVTQPKTVQTVWTQSVYNGSGDDIASGTVVRWDINASANDLSMWVETVDAIASIKTAGAVPYGYPLANGTYGEIIVKGPAILYNAGNTCTVDTGVESDATGYPVDETLAAADEALLGWVVVSNAGTLANTNLNSHYSVIFVQPTPYSGD